MPCAAPLGAPMRRREFISLLAGTVAWPLAASAQQPAKPVIGFLSPTRAEELGHLVAAVRQGLRESETGQVVIEPRWANNQEGQLPKLAAELVTLQVAAIVATGTASAGAAKAATSNIPIVFVVGEDPQRAGLVTSLNRPGGNVTGVSFYAIPVTGKRLALLRELVPSAEIIAFVQDPNFPAVQAETREIEAAVRASGQKILFFKAGSEQEISTVFSSAAQSAAGALLVGGGPFFNARRNQFVGLAALHAIPASYALSTFVDAGGLMSYGASQTDAHRRAGIYVARVLKGERPGDLPVELPTKYELATNLRSAKALGLNVPPSLLARADAVIE
jgi:putative tryptophan/tyrosine transport system substrate-binding protein